MPLASLSGGGVPREIAFDVTHIVSRLDRLATSGIDRVDLAYASHLTRRGRIASGVHYGLLKPHRLAPERVRALVERIERKLGDEGDAPSSAWPALRAWIKGEGGPAPVPPHTPTDTWRGAFRQTALRVASDGPLTLGPGAIYLNVAQHAFEFHRYFRWLAARPDILPVFLVHDLLPLDIPEFFRDNYTARFERRVRTVLAHARAIITTSDVVGRRIEAEYDRRGAPRVPIHVEPLASPLGGIEAGDRDEALRDHPYFVMVSTLEPRKNHAMVLNVWRSLVERLDHPPRLVLVGALGWDYGPTVAMLERSPALSRVVKRVSGLSRGDLRALLANARALLMPSFAEGYGIPIVEALSVGTPVLASDIPVFREVSQGCAEFLSPLNGEAWLSRVLEGTRLLAGASRSAAFRAPTWERYFAGIESFMADL